MGRTQAFVEYPEATLIDLKTTVGKLLKDRAPRDSILDLVIMKKQEESKGDESKPLLKQEEASEPPLGRFVPE